MIGKISLNISLLLYFIVFIPQLILNHQRQKTEGLSLLTQGLLCLGYLSDLFYGWGCQMQWQYRLVTASGLLCLFIQHYHFYQYGLKTKAERVKLGWVTSCIMVWFMGISFLIICYSPGRFFYDLMGLFATGCWMCCLFPQIIHNYLNQSTEGISFWFVVLSLVIKVCDILSAWSLNWDYPNKIGSVIFFLANVILLYQMVSYARRFKKPALGFNC